MRNEITYQGLAFDDDALREASMAVDTSLSERVLDVDAITATVSTRVHGKAFFFTHEGYRFYTHEGHRFLAAEQTVELPTDVRQDLPLQFLRGGSQYALWYPEALTHVGDRLYQISALSPLGRLLRMPHKGGVYNGVAAEDVIDEICGDVPHYVSPEFRNVPIYNWLPYLSPTGENGAQTGSAKDNLLQVLFALGAAVRDDAEGTLRIENLSDSVSSTLDADRVFRGTTRVRHELPVTSVTVLEHQFIPGGDETTLYEGTTVDGQVIVFDQPMSNLAATGFTVLESNANYAVLSAGSGTLTGQAYIHTMREVTKPVSEAAIPNVVRIEQATLVSITNSPDVINRLADYYAHRTRIECEASIAWEDAGDVVNVWDALSQTMRQACIEAISPLRASNIMRGTISALVDYTPWQVTPFEDERVLLTDSGTWTVPEGVTEITVVLIGGGQGGFVGNDGETANPTTTSYSSTSGGTTTRELGYIRENLPPTAGGLPGPGGGGGKILRFSIAVSPGDTFAYASGVGGDGAPYGSASAGDDGTDTTFGEYSSANGARSPFGYADPVTGTVYAGTGETGIPGGNGVGYENGEIVTPAPIEWNGESYYAGSRGAAGSISGGAYNQNAGYFSAEVSGALGGGPAAGANGENARASGAGLHQAYKPGVGHYYNAAAANSRPGFGADAAPPDAETIIGKGGRGGNGGGGSGQPAWPTYARRAYNASATLPTYDPPLSVTVDTRGGKGSRGGNAAPGGILIYYRQPVAT